MMTSTRPHLIRAFYDWIVENHCTPHFLADATIAGVQVPQQYVEKGQIVLNVAPAAVQVLHVGNTAVSFQARFGGVIYRIYLPIQSIMAVFAKENGQGTVFTEEVGQQVTAPAPQLESEEISIKGTTEQGTKPGRVGKSHLTLIK